MSSALSNVWCSLLARQPSKECEFASERLWHSQENVANLSPYYLQLMSLAARRAQKTRFSRGKAEREDVAPDVAEISLRIQWMRVDPTEIPTSDPKHLLLLLLQTVTHSHADSQRKFYFVVWPQKVCLVEWNGGGVSFCYAKIYKALKYFTHLMFLTAEPLLNNNQMHHLKVNSFCDTYLIAALVTRLYNFWSRQTDD